MHHLIGPWQGRYIHGTWRITYLTEFESLGLLLLTKLGVSLVLLQKRLRKEHILGARHRAESVSIQRS